MIVYMVIYVCKQDNNTLTKEKENTNEGKI